MNLEIAHQKCIDRVTEISNNNKTAAKYVCKFNLDKLVMCKSECSQIQNEQYNKTLEKCVSASKNDQELNECIQQSNSTSTIKLCVAKCEMNTLRDFQSYIN